MPADLLLEIGTEELPASFIASALGAMPDLAERLLTEARLEHGPVRTFGTPRRLALLVMQVAERQADLSVEVVGPPKSIAFGAKGEPQKPAIAFAAGLGKTAADLYTVQTDKGEKVALRREEKGKAATEVLPPLLESLIKALPFPKSMRWGTGEVAFGRPVHWMVALHGGEVVRFSFAGIASGRQSRGHRFLATGPVELATPADYLDRLRAGHVLADVAERRSRMEEALARAAAEIGADLVPDAFLIEECMSLVEEPHVVPGRFDEAFLSIPAPVIVAVLRNHQRYFALTGQGGALLPRYLNVVNTARDPETISRGNDRVLKARLADARFFVDEDRKSPLAARVPKLDGVVFQTKLGSLGDKVARMMDAARAIAERTGADPGAAARAAELSKADLLTLIVGEFPELQGEMGRHYALADGEPGPVADAVREHYQPRGAADAVPPSALGAVVALADRIDTLAGCFGIGQKPTGSADPFGLRRAALGVIRISLEPGMESLDLASMVERAVTAYGDKGVELAADTPAAIEEFFRGRLRALYGERFPADAVEACLAAWSPAQPFRDLERRIMAVSAFRGMAEYESLAVAFKRAFNIAKEAKPGFETSALVEEAEKLLADRFVKAQGAIDRAVQAGDYEAALRTVATELRTPIDRFFDDVLVMAEDERLRKNRLGLLASIVSSVRAIAHFDLLSTRSA